jgi:hypothetical protein
MVIKGYTADSLKRNCLRSRNSDKGSTSSRPNRNQIIVARIERIGTRDNYRLLPIESLFIGQLLHGRLREVGMWWRAIRSPRPLN